MRQPGELRISSTRCELLQAPIFDTSSWIPFSEVSGDESMAVKLLYDGCTRQRRYNRFSSVANFSGSNRS